MALVVEEGFIGRLGIEDIGMFSAGVEARKKKDGCHNLDVLGYVRPCYYMWSKQEMRYTDYRLGPSRKFPSGFAIVFWRSRCKGSHSCYHSGSHITCWRSHSKY